VIRFSTARMTPSFVAIPRAVDPSCRHKDQGGTSTSQAPRGQTAPAGLTCQAPASKGPGSFLALKGSAYSRVYQRESRGHDGGCTLMASMAYSTWKRRPSGEKVLTPLSVLLLDQPKKGGGKWQQRGKCWQGGGWGQGEGWGQGGGWGQGEGQESEPGPKGWGVPL